MAAAVILVEASPRDPASGAPVTLRLAGGGGAYPYFYGEQHWRAGIAGLPRTIASLDFDGEQLGGGGVPQAMELRWSPAGRALLSEAAALYWADAPITVRVEPEGDALPPIATAGLVLDAPVEANSLRITLSDAAADLKKSLLTDRFAGTGGLEGPTELENVIKSRAWGRCFNVPGLLIDKANNIWCFGDPRQSWRSFVQVRDRGVAATAVLILGWQGSAEATFAALKGTAAVEGGCVVCPSIACVKWWTAPSGDLKADIEGETAGGYVETAPEIVARLVAVRSTTPIAAGALAEAVAWRPAPCGWRIDNDTVTAADAVSELLGDVSLSWLLTAGEIRFRRWEWSASTRVARSHRVMRRSTVKPIGTRKLGYRRNWSPMARGDLAAIVLAQDVAYDDGTPVEALKPAQAGADVTGQNTAADTKAVGGVLAQTVVLQLEKIEQIEQIKSDVSAIALAQAGHAAELAVLDDARIDMEAVQRQMERDAGRLSEATLRLLAEANRTRTVLRDAGIVVDPVTGIVRIYAVDQLAEKTSKVELTLDAQKALITTKASTDYVNEKIALAVLDPAQAAQLEPIIARLASAEQSIDGLNALVRQKADLIELTRVGGRVSTVEQGLDAVTGLVATKASQTVVDRLGATLSAVEQQLGTIGDTIGLSVSVRQARIVADQAAEGALRALLAGDDANQRQIAQVAQARQELTTRMDAGLLTEATYRLALAVEVANVRALTIAETTARITGDETAARSIAALGVTTDAQSVAIGRLDQAVIGVAGGVAGTQTTIRQIARRDATADEASLRALIAGDQADQRRQAQLVQIQTELTTTMVANEAASAVARQALLARMGRAESAALDLTKVVAALDASTATRLQALDAQFAAQAADIVTTVSRITREEQARADGLAAEARARDALSARVNGVAGDAAKALADVGAERQARVEGDQAEAVARETLAAQVNAVGDDATQALAEIGAERRVRAEADQAEAEARRVLSSQVNDPSTGLPWARSAIADLARVTNDRDNSLASSIQQVRSYLDGIGNVGLQQAFEAVVNRLGKVEGRWSIVIDANGNLSGIQLIGSSSGPASFNLINTDLKLGTGRVIFDTGTFMKVEGVGFGVAKDLIEWFGPTMTVDKCSRANALSFKATDGAIYTSGSLSAGTLRNGGASSSLAADATAEVPSFGSNGKPVRYVASWSYTSEWTNIYQADSNGLRAFDDARAAFNATTDDGGLTYFGSKPEERASSTITLSRAFGQTYEQLEQRSFTTEQLTFRGLRPVTGAGEAGNAVFTATIGGGFTVLDHVQSTANRSLRLALSRGFNLSEGVIQRLTIVAVEE